MAIEGTIHKAGALKQTNKSHKHGKHRSNRQIDADNKGRVSLKVSTKNKSKTMRREDRRLQAIQIRKNKREEAMDKKRKLGGLSGMSAPFLTCFVPLHEEIDVNSALAILESCDEDAIIDKTNPKITYLKSPRLKQKFSFIKAVYGPGNELRNLDCLKVVDSTVFLLSASCEDVLDRWGEKFVNLALSQGIPTPTITLMDLESIAPKRRAQVKADIQKRINKYFPDEKLMVLDKTSDGQNLLRRIGGQKKNEIHNKNNRPHLYSEKAELNEENNVLKVTGYLRGIPLNVNSLVHVPGLGSFQMTQIHSTQDPLKAPNDASTSSNVCVYANPALQTSLISENIPDEMDAEQTFPTDAEIAQSMEENNKKKFIKRIPKGMSDYQACWIPDIEEIDENNDESESDDDDNSFMSCDSNASDQEADDDDGMKSATEDDNEEFEDVTENESTTNNEQRYDEQMDLYEEKEAQEKLKAQRTDAMWPDEVDTPNDIPARVRFQKFRGLESFRTSPWDVKENLPFDYAKIFQFKDFNRIKRRIIKEAAESDETIVPGMYVTIHIANVATNIWEEYQKLNGISGNLIVYGLLPHENKMSVMNVVLKRAADSTIPIKSKERLIIQCGFRRFIVNPIFSQHTNGNKHKFERFFQPNSTVVASFFAPIQFPPAPVLCLRENPNGSVTMIANGILMSCSPDRVVLKRVVLSGHPFKINRRTATVRFMFHNKDDIDYFKPCKLRTKCGRIGHIKESLGTHGHMKCVFDGQMKSFDTVFLYLYKRIFPKWTYEEYRGKGQMINSAAVSSVDINME
ncbi:CLUMA_CG020082, isoform A [Clunio marinus]|uniref:Pre-rRNA-processing protein TSR1 homolog n=1 Tax=Clunio marinus TaxID=568069 RepID=A0A1J1J3R8_9DIPT|nr:CLUMA_CG020082, isoform A [Clunio marinus]